MTKAKGGGRRVRETFDGWYAPEAILDLAAATERSEFADNLAKRFEAGDKVRVTVELLERKARRKP